jgi:hypothetical protein
MIVFTEFIAVFLVFACERLQRMKFREIVLTVIRSFYVLFATIRKINDLRESQGEVSACIRHRNPDERGAQG